MALLRNSMELNQESRFWSAASALLSPYAKGSLQQKNGMQYNQSLINRGSMAFWINEEANKRVDLKQTE